MTASQVYHFDVPMAIHSTVSWSQVRDVGPLIDHTRQISGSGALDLGIYNLVFQAAPIWLTARQKDTQPAPGFSRGYSATRSFVYEQIQDIIHKLSKTFRGRCWTPHDRPFSIKTLGRETAPLQNLISWCNGTIGFQLSQHTHPQVGHPWNP